MGIIKNLVKNAIEKNKKLEPITVPVVGLNFYTDNIIKIATPLKGYNLSPGQMQHSNKHIFFQYFFKCEKTEIIHEANNKVNPNALMVMVDGVKIGYIPDFMIDEVKPYLNIPCEIKSEIKGGNMKKREYDGSITEEARQFTAEIKITPKV